MSYTCFSNDPKNKKSKINLTLAETKQQQQQYFHKAA